MSFFKKWYDWTITIGFVGIGISIVIADWKSQGIRVFMLSLFIIFTSIIYAGAQMIEEKAKDKEAGQ